MNTLGLQLHFWPSILTNPATNHQQIFQIKSSLRNNFNSKPIKDTTNTCKSLNQELKFLKSKILPPNKTSNGESRIAILGAMSLGLALFLMGFDDHKAMAFGPEGPLMEEFWENMRRYALYALTVPMAY